jgi:multisubunit Na+/H+ antiporter MnhB subunit
MTLLQWAFDIVLGSTLIWLAWRVLASEDLFKGIVLFIAFGLLMAFAWVRLDAPDIALAEAAIGAGLTGALLLAALAKLEAVNKSSRPSQTITRPLPYRSWLFRSWLVILPISLVLILTTGLIYAILSLPSQTTGLGLQVAENIEASGVSNPVTSVLLNFRAYDTLLEMAVLLLAVLGVWSLAAIPEHSEPAPGAVLDMLSRLLMPLLILVSGYLLWVGGHAAGGAFQAGSVLAAAGVLLLLTGWRPSARFAGWPLRFLLILGLAIFVLVAVLMLLLGYSFLEFPLSLASTLILLIEAAAALSIGITLAALFLGSRPPPVQSSPAITADHTAEREAQERQP